MDKSKETICAWEQHRDDSEVLQHLCSSLMDAPRKKG